jgi:heterodisulfide reductase subunit A-like polyferredoxin
MISEEVLIVGGGYAGLTTAAALAESGIASTVIDAGGEFGGKLARLDRLYQTETMPRKLVAGLLQELEDAGRVELLKETSLTEASGVAGNFECTLQTGNSKRSKRFGAIVLATGSTVKTPEGLLPLGELEGLPKSASAVCIILAPGGSSSPVQTEAALGGARALRDRGLEVTVLYQQMSVAGAGLQGLYDDARAAGVVFGRYAGTPAVSKNNGAFDVEFAAEDLAQRVRIRCDAVASEGGEQPSPGARELGTILDIAVDGAGFFQKENVSLYPVSTRRRGILAVGSCRRPATLEEVVSDSHCAAEQIREMFAVLRKGPPVEAPVVDTEKCAFCLTCYRACPQSGSITRTGRRRYSRTRASRAASAPSSAPQGQSGSRPLWKSRSRQR